LVRRGRAHSLFFVCAVGLASATPGCGGSAPARVEHRAAAPKAATPAPSAPAPPPFELDAALREESHGLAEISVADPAANWRVTVPSAAPPRLQRVGGVSQLAIPVGGGLDVRCQAHDQAIDAAGTIFSLLHEGAARVRYVSLEPARLRVLAGAPVAGVSALYTSDGGAAVGSLKVAVQSGERRSLLCLLDGLGHERTFERVSGAFFESFNATGDAPSAARYTEVTRARLGDVDAGFGIVRLFPGAEQGTVEYRHSSSHLMPEAPGELSFHDAYTVLRLNAEGRLLAGTWAATSAGQLELRVEVTRSRGGYTVSGQLAGERREGALSAPNGLSTALEVAALLKQRLSRGEPFSVTVAEYHPSLEALATVGVRYSRAPDAPPRQVVMELGQTRFTATLDQNGLPEDGWFDLGDRRLTVTRAHVAGRW
jgi:hypothetical protein